MGLPVRLVSPMERLSKGLRVFYARRRARRPILREIARENPSRKVLTSKRHLRCAPFLSEVCSSNLVLRLVRALHGVTPQS